MNSGTLIKAIPVLKGPWLSTNSLKGWYGKGYENDEPNLYMDEIMRWSFSFLAVSLWVCESDLNVYPDPEDRGSQHNHADMYISCLFR